jgi:hypothetical protein
MKIELKSVNLTKSKIMQMDYVGIPKNKNADVLGYVNVDKKRWVIVKSEDNYYRADYITKVETDFKGFQFPLESGGWEFPQLHHILVSTYNRNFNYSPERDDQKNIELYHYLMSFKRKCETASQIYY